MTSARHVVLIGLMASGKSTVGHRLAVRWGRPFVDNDETLAAHTGMSAREIATAQGADVLHRYEAEALVAALARRVPAVGGAAAAAPLEPITVASMAGHDVVYLRASPEVLADRLRRSADDGHRPFVDAGADAGAVIEAQFAARDDRYRALATLIVDADRDGRLVVDEISSALERPAL
jgi:shikimate kinase